VVEPPTAAPREPCEESTPAASRAPRPAHESGDVVDVAPDESGVWAPPVRREVALCGAPVPIDPRAKAGESGRHRAGAGEDPVIVQVTGEKFESPTARLAVRFASPTLTGSVIAVCFTLETCEVTIVRVDDSASGLRWWRLANDTAAGRRRVCWIRSSERTRELIDHYLGDGRPQPGA
jgi:hypothetical protein